MTTDATQRDGTFAADLAELGFAIVDEVVAMGQVDAILLDLGQISTHKSTRQGDAYAARNLLSTSPRVAQLARSPELQALVELILGTRAFPVRGILFDKVPGANWHVGWHQDRFIPIAERRDAPGYSAWTVKGDIPHAQPPAAVLERMLTLRVHLDSCMRDNGALKVIPGTHRNGIIGDEGISALVTQTKATICEAKRGTVLALRPLLLHASSPAMSPSHRRVIHIEYAADPLPGGLAWPDWNQADVAADSQ